MRLIAAAAARRKRIRTNTFNGVGGHISVAYQNRKRTWKESIDTQFWQQAIWRCDRGALVHGLKTKEVWPGTALNLFSSFSKSMSAIGLASDDVTKLSNAWQRGTLVLNKGSNPYKKCWEKSLSLGKALYFFAERSKKFWQLLHSFVCHISKDIAAGNRTSAGLFFGRSTISQHAFVWDAIFV